MVYPVVTGHPEYGPSGAGFIPEIWSGKILMKFYDSTLLVDITNNDYEGEIKSYGAVVIIRSPATVAISDYVAGQPIKYQRPSSVPTELTIDKGKVWGLELDDVMAIQSDIKLLDKWTDDAGQNMKIEIETDFFADIYSDASDYASGNTAGYRSGNIKLGAALAPAVITPDVIVGGIIDCGLALDELNCPQVGRWMVLPNAAIAMLKKSDIADSAMTGDPRSPVRTGEVGMVDRFKLFGSNLLSYDSTDGAYHALFGHNEAVTFATQLIKTESLRSQDAFADLVRGLQVYGYKCIHPECLGEWYIKLSS